MVAAAAAAVALTGWRIDYVGNWSGRRAIYSVDASGRGPIDRVAADGTADVDDPQPSPDGRHLLFGEHGEVLLARAGGHVLRALWVPKPELSFVGSAWAPDSTRIGYLVQDVHEAALHVARSDGTDDRVVETVGGNAPWRIAWSRDSRRVRVVTARDSGVSPDGRWHIVPRYGVAYGFAVARTGASQPVVSAAGNWQTWSPDSRLLAYTTSRGIAVLDVRTRRVRLLTSDIGSLLTWAPDGSAIAYVDCCADSLTLALGDLRTVSLTGRVRVVARAAAPNGGVVSEVTWVRRARGISYTSAPASAAGVYTAQPVTRLAADGARVVYAACGRLFVWTPATGGVTAGPTAAECRVAPSAGVFSLAIAGDQLAWTTLGGGNTKSWTTALEVFGQSQQLLTSGSQTCCTSWPVVAGAGAVFVYADRVNDFKTQTWTVRAAGGPPLITFQQNAFVPVALDVDGDRVLVARDGAADVVLSENGGSIFHLEVPELHPPQAQLDGPDVDVLANGVLDVYATNGGDLLDAWPAPAGATLLDARHGLAALSADGEILVIRVGDGLRARVAPGTLAAFMDEGLAVANGARVSLVPFGRLPS